MATRQASPVDEASYYFGEKWAKTLINQDMEGVWISVLGDTAFINLAPVINDIVYYPDLIKVKISLTDGSLLGWEANSYLQNHINREITPPSISQEQALQKISPRLKVHSIRLVI